MKHCPNCNQPHTKPGIFCTRSCANSRGVRTDDFKEKVRKKLTGKLKTNNLSVKNAPFRELDRFKKQADGPFCFVQKNTCKLTNKIFYSQYYRCYSTEAIYSKMKLYRISCRFNLNKKDHPELFDSMLITKYGWYVPSNKPNTNLNGVCWDHLFRIEEGFKKGINPSFLKHPANAELVPWIINKKRTQSTITYPELINRIKMWDSGIKVLPKFFIL